MTRPRFNAGVFLLESLNSLGTAFYFNYLFFFLKSEFAFSNLQNLLVCAANGFLYIPCAYYAGKFGQKRGYLTALACGFSVMSVSLAASAFARSVPGLMLLMLAWTIGMCFTWPNLEALVCDQEPPRRLPGVIGAYNVVWAASSALAYFSGGAVVETLGWRSIFWIPASIHAGQLLVLAWLRPRWKTILSRAPEGNGEVIHESHPEGAAFLKLAWLANPFAYIAINATVPLIPDLAQRLQLSPRLAGFFCSIWFFSRMAAFVVLAFWPNWHYRFGYLASAYVGMLFCFAAMLLSSSLWLVLVAQLAFGWCIGLIYYSSLYYSMHVGDTKGVHGGIHEAAIGTGIFAGPAIGAASLYFFPDFKQSSVIGVAVVLAVGFVILLLLRRRGKRP